VELVRAPGFSYGGEWVEITEEWIDQRVEDYARVGERGYRSPILREHDFDGAREGKVVELAKEIVEGEPTLAAKLRFVDAEDAAKMRDGRQPYVSVQLADIITDNDDEVDDFVLEVSLVGVPHAMTAETHVLRAASGREIWRAVMPKDAMGREPGDPEYGKERMAEEQSAAEDTEEMSDMERMMKRMGSLEELVAKMAESQMGPPPVERKTTAEEQTDIVKDEEKLALQREVAELRRSAAWAKFEKEFPAGQMVKVSTKAVRALFEVVLKAGDEGNALADALVEGAVEGAAEPTMVVEQGGVYRKGWAKTADSEATVSRVTEAEKYKRCLAKHGGDYTKANEEMAKFWTSPEYIEAQNKQRR
tara:strand:+ start:4715 stop:5800 length:1086 start_codon:yes stop_codon:yes gene_type:complete